MIPGSDLSPGMYIQVPTHYRSQISLPCSFAVCRLLSSSSWSSPFWFRFGVGLWYMYRNVVRPAHRTSRDLPYGIHGVIPGMIRGTLDCEQQSTIEDRRLRSGVPSRKGKCFFSCHFALFNLASHVLFLIAQERIIQRPRKPSRRDYLKKCYGNDSHDARTT